MNWKSPKTKFSYKRKHPSESLRLKTCAEDEGFPTASTLAGLMFLFLMLIEAQVQHMSLSLAEVGGLDGAHGWLVENENRGGQRQRCQVV